MGRFLSQSRADLRPVKKQQVFTVSGIFTPSDALLEAGGVVTVRCVGGGGGGESGSSSNGYYKGAGSGSSGTDITRIVTIAGPVEVLIGAGGSGGVPTALATSGGDTSFGAYLIAPGGNPGGDSVGGRASGEGSLPGGGGRGRVTYGANTTGDKNLFVSSCGGGCGGGNGSAHAPPNTGGGGAGIHGTSYAGNGGSGICIVTWEE